MDQENQERELKNWHDKNYKFLLLIPIILLVLSLTYLIYFYKQNGDIINRDISLKGGTAITVNQPTNTGELRKFLSSKLEDFDIREISDLRTGAQIAFILETTIEPTQAKQILEEYLGYQLTEQNSSTEFTGSTLSQNFYKQLRTAILIAFILMAIVVFLIFRTFIPSFAVVLSAFADITMTLAAVNLLGIKMSSAGIVALLMLIGYSVDSDILLTTRVLKQKNETLNSRILSAFKTGITMTLTSLAAIIIVLLIVRTLSPILTQIFTIILIGLCFDLPNTWFANVGILKLYCKKKNID